MDKTKIAAGIVCTTLGIAASIFTVKLTLAFAEKTFVEVAKALPTEK